MKWILFVMISYGSSNQMMDHAEFNDRKACQKVADQISVMDSFTNNLAFCVPNSSDDK